MNDNTDDRSERTRSVRERTLLIRTLLVLFDLRGEREISGESAGVSLA
jgi:hypothetical protein